MRVSTPLTLYWSSTALMWNADAWRSLRVEEGDHVAIRALLK
jgi:hypothetical protein